MTDTPFFDAVADRLGDPFADTVTGHVAGPRPGAAAWSELDEVKRRLALVAREQKRVRRWSGDSDPRLQIIAERLNGLLDDHLRLTEAAMRRAVDVDSLTDEAA